MEGREIKLIDDHSDSEKSDYQNESLSMQRRRFIRIASAGVGLGMGTSLHGILATSVQANIWTDILAALASGLAILQGLLSRGDTARGYFAVTNQSYYNQSGYVVIEITYDADTWHTWITQHRDRRTDTQSVFVRDLAPGESRPLSFDYKTSSSGVHVVVLSTNESSLKTQFTVA